MAGAHIEAERQDGAPAPFASTRRVLVWRLPVLVSSPS